MAPKWHKKEGFRATFTRSGPEGVPGCHLGSILEDLGAMDLGVIWEWTWKVCFMYSEGICYGFLNEFGTLFAIALH